MAKEKKGQPDPEREREEVVEAGAEAMQEVLAGPGTLKDLLADITPDDVIMNNPESRYLKANQNTSGGWLYAPAVLETFAAAEEYLLQAAADRGRPTREIKLVRACHIPKKRLVFIWPTFDDDPEGIPTSRQGSSLRINLSSLLATSGQRVKAGYKEKYNIFYAPGHDSPFGPAIWFLVGKPLERKRDYTKKKSESGGESSEQGTAEGIEPAAKQPKKQKVEK